MSLFDAALVGVAGTLQDVLLRQGRSINGIIPQVVIEEQHHDEMAITSHPVQDGAAITDHAFKQPSIVSMRCGWSQSGSNVPLASLTQPTPKDVYNMLLNLQQSRTPFDLVTGKRSYTGMLIRSLNVVTDADTENVLVVEATFQQILIVSVQTATLPAANMANPASNAPSTNMGTKQPTPVPESLLFKAGSTLGPLLGIGG